MNTTILLGVTSPLTLATAAVFAVQRKANKQKPEGILHQTESVASVAPKKVRFAPDDEPTTTPIVNTTEPVADVSITASPLSSTEQSTDDEPASTAAADAAATLRDALLTPAGFEPVVRAASLQGRAAMRVAEFVASVAARLMSKRLADAAPHPQDTQPEWTGEPYAQDSLDISNDARSNAAVPVPIVDDRTYNDTATQSAIDVMEPERTESTVKTTYAVSSAGALVAIASKEAAAPDTLAFQRAVEADEHHFAEELASNEARRRARHLDAMESAPWWLRLDPSLDDASLAARRALASSLRNVRAKWVATLVQHALDREEDASVRGRLLAVLVAQEGLLDDAVVADYMRRCAQRSPVEAAAALELGFVIET